MVEVWNSFGYQDISQYISSIRIQNSVDAAVGTMTLVINPSSAGNLPTAMVYNAIINEVEDRLKLNSIISAKINKASTKYSFLGRIDNIYPRIISDGNSTFRELVVNCSLLLPKLLMRDEIINFPLLKYVLGANEILGADRVNFLEGMRGNLAANKTNVFQGGKPEEAVKWIINNCIATNTTVIISAAGSPSGITLKSFFDPNKADTFRFTFIEGEQLWNTILSVFSGPLMNYINQCIDRDYYEIFFDTEIGDDKMAFNSMTIRPKAYSFKDYIPQHTPDKKYDCLTGWVNFEDLDTITKTSDQRLTDNTGISDYELKNSFSVNFQQSVMAPANSLFGQQGPLFPLLNFDLIKKYGLRHLQLDSTVVNFEDSRDAYNKGLEDANPQDFIKIISQPKGELDYLLDKREKAFEWYSYPYFSSGQIIWAGDENIKVGQRLVYQDKQFIDPEEGKIYNGVEYLVNGITHDFAFGKFFRTTTDLVRGCPAGLAAAWLNKNRSGFVSPTIQDYNALINPSIQVNKDELTQIKDLHAQWLQQGMTLL